MQILPDSAPNGARYSNVVLKAGQFPFDGQGNQFCHHRTALNPELGVVAELEMARGIADDQATESLVTDENIGAQPQHEVIESELAGGSNCPCQVIDRCCIVEEISGTTNPECGVLSKRLISFEPLGVQPSFQLPVSIRAGLHRI